MLILRDIFDTLTDKEMEEIVPCLVDAFSEHPDLDCQKLYFEILLLTYNKFKTDAGIVQKAKIGLLKGLRLIPHRTSIIEGLTANYDKSNCSAMFIIMLR